ncbi:hypothetical protein [Mameliella sp.]|uniref:hypothetical protein n=1 Tax=Mameliella sp. TaxID=1924940 RepID=UPI003B5007E9
MTGRRLFEGLVCLGLALAVHAVVLALIALPNGETSDPALNLVPASPEMGALVAAWDRPPDTDIPQTPDAPPDEAAPAAPAKGPLTPTRTPVPRAPGMPAVPSAPPEADPTPRPRPVSGGLAPDAPRLPAPFSATELQTSRAALRGAPTAPRAPGAGIVAPTTGALPRIDTEPAAPPPAEPAREAAPAVTPDAQPAPEPTPDPATPPAPEPEPIPQPEPDLQPEPRPDRAPETPAPPLGALDPQRADPELGPPTAQAPATALRPIARPFLRPDPFLPRPVARPSGLGDP